MNSWKTTFAGLAAILTGLGMLGKILNDFGIGEPISFEQVSAAIAAIAGGIGLLAARDNTKTSEDVGVAPPYYGGLLVLVLIPAILMTGCPKSNETIRDFKENSAKLKIYGRNIQRSFNESFDAGSLTKPQLAALTKGSAKFRDAVKALDAGIRAAEEVLKHDGDRRTALDTIDRILSEQVVKSFDELVEAITGHTVVSETAKEWIAAARVALAALRVLIASGHSAIGVQYV